MSDEDPDAISSLEKRGKSLAKVSLKMLSRLAFAVNHRQMHEAVELFSDSWIENLKRDLSLPLTTLSKYIKSIYHDARRVSVSYTWSIIRSGTTKRNKVTKRAYSKTRRKTSTRYVAGEVINKSNIK